MQYPKCELDPDSQMETLALLRAAFNSVDEVLILIQDQGLVLETNLFADRCCRSAHHVNVGGLLWHENIWLSQEDREHCRQAFLKAVKGEDAEFDAVVLLGEQKPKAFSFSLKNLNIGFPTERYFLLLGHQRG